MRCDQAELRLQTLLDNRQQVDQDAALNEHLATCGECATLASAYRALAADRCAEPTSSASLSDRVLSELATTPAATNTYAPHQQASVHWQRWVGLALAASVAIVVSLNLQPGSTLPTPPSVDQRTPQIATNIATTAADKEVPGGQMWFRTGQGLASISLVGLSRRSTSVNESESPSDQQPSNWSIPMPIQQIWPPSEESSPGSDETGLLFRNVSYGVA